MINRDNRVLGLAFCTDNIETIVNATLDNQYLGERINLLITPNVDHVVTMNKDSLFKEICESAWLLTADGWPVVKLLQHCGVNVAGRITGADLFPKIIDGLAVTTQNPFFVCSSEEAAQFYIEWLTERGYSTPEQRVAVPAFGFEKDELYSEQLVQKINALQTTHLFFGVGAPKSEKWMYRYRDQLPQMVGFGFGAALDFYAGLKSRAPEWVQKIGMEWFWRLSSEPKRLAKRYLVSSWVFLGIAIRESNRLNGTK
jgi:N-acetylglucosaminyldiphosphoundecaprenol N-acetyl-beta-D-mannosaminyltransferase